MLCDVVFVPKLSASQNQHAFFHRYKQRRAIGRNEFVVELIEGMFVLCSLRAAYGLVCVFASIYSIFLLTAMAIGLEVASEQQSEQWSSQQQQYVFKVPRACRSVRVVLCFLVG